MGIPACEIRLNPLSALALVRERRGGYGGVCQHAYTCISRITACWVLRMC
jgi:hypothetical protein